MAYEASISALADLLDRGDAVVLTGAGMSTDSGIPAYRDEEGRWQQKAPMQHQEFVGSELARQRYWARSIVGWPVMARAKPNRAHIALAELERLGRLRLLITQNVDSLHGAAGSHGVVELHGRLDQVVCLNCKSESPRSELQTRLIADNPDFVSGSFSSRADGDAELSVDCSRFRVPPCARCGGVLKPDVVFFGENVPRSRVKEATEAIESARSLLIAGSSLILFSGFRFARLAARSGVPIAIVNRGKTRADELSSLRIEGNVGDVLDGVLEAAVLS
jgi:NAD-dependent SIR2 family protein deacetylase